VPTPDDHAHCKVCGRVCPAGEETCSAACASERERRARSRRTYVYLMYGTIALLLLVLLAHYV
jgi:predicted nucleic acid-binding Zn ribbon protein